MRKIWLITGLIIFHVILVLVLGRNILARTIVVNGIKQASGLHVAIGKIDIGLPAVTVRDIKVYSPAGFSDSVLADIAEISVQMNFRDILSNKIHLSRLGLDVRQIHLELNEQGRLNVNSLALLMPKPGGGAPPEVRIDELAVKVGKVSYKGSFPAGAAKTMEFAPDINVILHDVTDPAKVSVELFQKIISRAGIGQFADFAVKGIVKDTLDSVGKGLKGLFDSK